MNNITAIIPVRAGSQRVKGKNFKAFSSSNLLEIKIKQIKQLSVDRIIVNADSQEAIRIAKKHNVEFFEREPYYASSKCNGSEYHEYLAKVTNAENLLIAQVTCPLIKTKSYLSAIQKFFAPVNYSLDNMPNSQDLEAYQVPTFGIVICKKKKMLEYKNFICGKCSFVELDDIESIDIDTPFDFEFAEFAYNKFWNVK